MAVSATTRSWYELNRCDVSWLVGRTESASRLLILCLISRNSRSAAVSRLQLQLSAPRGSLWRHGTYSLCFVRLNAGSTEQVLPLLEHREHAAGNLCGASHASSLILADATYIAGNRVAVVRVLLLTFIWRQWTHATKLGFLPRILVVDQNVVNGDEISREKWIDRPAESSKCGRRIDDPLQSYQWIIDFTANPQYNRLCIIVFTTNIPHVTYLDVDQFQMLGLEYLPLLF